MSLRQKSISRKKAFHWNTCQKSLQLSSTANDDPKSVFHNDDDDDNDEVNGGDEKALTSEEKADGPHASDFDTSLATSFFLEKMPFSSSRGAM